MSLLILHNQTSLHRHHLHRCKVSRAKQWLSLSLRRIRPASVATLGFQAEALAKTPNGSSGVLRTRTARPSVGPLTWKDVSIKSCLPTVFHSRPGERYQDFSSRMEAFEASAASEANKDDPEYHLYSWNVDGGPGFRIIRWDDSACCDTRRRLRPADNFNRLRLERAYRFKAKENRAKRASGLL